MSALNLARQYNSLALMEPSKGTSLSNQSGITPGDSRTISILLQSDDGVAGTMHLWVEGNHFANLEFNNLKMPLSDATVLQFGGEFHGFANQNQVFENVRVVENAIGPNNFNQNELDNWVMKLNEWLARVKRQEEQLRLIENEYNKLPDMD